MYRLFEGKIVIAVTMLTAVMVALPPFKASAQAVQESVPASAGDYLAAARDTPGAAVPLTVEIAVDTALHENPGLSEMRARADAMAAIPSQAGSLPDPRLSVGAVNFPTDGFSFTHEPMTQVQVGLSQVIPFPGKLTLSRRAAEYDAAAALHNVDETRLLLVRDVRTTWWRLFSLDRSLSIVGRNKTLLRQFIQVALSKYKVGKGLQQDVLLAQLELSRLTDLELRLGGMRASEQARMNALLATSAGSSIKLPETVDTSLPELAGQQTLYDRAERVRPLLAIQLEHIRAARTRVELAERDYYPDFNIGAEYGARGGRNADGSNRSDMMSFQLSINLPIFTGRKQSKAVDQRNSELLEGTFKLHDLRNGIRADIAAAISEYNQARGQFTLFETGILPQARQTVASMLAGYQVNKVDFLNLVNSQVTLYNYEMNYWQTLSDARQAAARLAAAVGEDHIYE